MREFGGLVWGLVVDECDVYQLRAAWAFLMRAVDPLAEAEVVFADRLRGDKNIVARLVEFFVRDAQESEALWSKLQHAIGLDFWAVQLDASAVIVTGAVGRLGGVVLAVAVLILILVLILVFVLGMRLSTLGGALFASLLFSAAFAFFSAALAPAFARLA